MRKGMKKLTALFCSAVLAVGSLPALFSRPAVTTGLLSTCKTLKAEAEE